MRKRDSPHSRWWSILCKATERMVRGRAWIWILDSPNSCLFHQQFRGIQMTQGQPYVLGSQDEQGERVWREHMGFVGCKQERDPGLLNPELVLGAATWAGKTLLVQPHFEGRPKLVMWTLPRWHILMSWENKALISLLSSQVFSSAPRFYLC